MTSSHPELDRMMTLAEVGREIGGFCKRTIQRMIAAGELPRPIKIRGRSLLPVSAVRAFLDKQRDGEHK